MPQTVSPTQSTGVTSLHSPSFPSSVDHSMTDAQTECGLNLIANLVAHSSPQPARPPAAVAPSSAPTTVAGTSADALPATPNSGAVNSYAAVNDDLLAVLSPNLVPFNSLAEFKDKFIPTSLTPREQAEQAVQLPGHKDFKGKLVYANRISLVTGDDLSAVLQVVKNKNKLTKEDKEFMADVFANLKAEPFKVSTQSSSDASKALPNSEVEVPGYLMHLASYKSFLSEELKKTSDGSPDYTEIEALLHHIQKSEAAVSAVLQGKKK